MSGFDILARGIGGHNGVKYSFMGYLNFHYFSFLTRYLWSFHNITSKVKFEKNIYKRCIKIRQIPQKKNHPIVWGVIFGLHRPWLLLVPAEPRQLSIIEHTICFDDNSILSSYLQSKLCNQVPSLSPSRWKTLTLEKFKVGWVLCCVKVQIFKQ